MENIHLPDQQGFIPSIFNYCDRRCERCRFVRQCRVGIIDVDDVDEDRTGVAEERVEDYAERLRKVMGLPPPGEEGDEERDGGGWSLEIDEDMAPDPDYEAEQQAVRDKVKAHPFTDISLTYADMVDEWLGPREERLKVKGVSLHRMAELTIDPALRTPTVI
ncbi:MAG TPA: hypothetical protein VHL57_02220, partial [Flavobacteriales bacterium]|nr:hypothetical protein [Flavobacteriales bacterium]